MSSSSALFVLLLLTIAGVAYGKFESFLLDNEIFKTFPICRLTSEEITELTKCSKNFELYGESMELLCKDWNDNKDCYKPVFHKFHNRCWPSVQTHFGIDGGLGAEEIWNQVDEYSDLLQKLICKNGRKIGEEIVTLSKPLLKCSQETIQALLTKGEAPSWTNDIQTCLMTFEIIMDYLSHESLCKTFENMNPSTIPNCLAGTSPGSGSDIQICGNAKITKLVGKIFKQKEGRDLLKRSVCLYELYNNSSYKKLFSNEQNYETQKTEL